MKKKKITTASSKEIPSLKYKHICYAHVAMRSSNSFYVGYAAHLQDVLYPQSIFGTANDHFLNIHKPPG